MTGEPDKPRLPHAGWADLYDAVYERGYGSLYAWLTGAALDEITAGLTVPNRALNPDVRIADFGAGTGRLALPLAERGYRVTAVEPVKEMLDRLEGKARERGLDVEPIHGRMADFDSPPVFDLAVCVFTVLLYILDGDELRRSFRAVAGCLKPGGRFLVDAPRREMFASGVVRGEGVKRVITVTPRGGDLYDYREETSVDVEGRKAEFQEAFPIRYWPRETVLFELAAVGLNLEQDLSKRFHRSGCDYFWLKKA